jgi:hypothetical protein
MCLATSRRLRGCWKCSIDWQERYTFQTCVGRRRVCVFVSVVAGWEFPVWELTLRTNQGPRWIEAGWMGRIGNGTCNVMRNMV